MTTFMLLALVVVGLTLRSIGMSRARPAEVPRPLSSQEQTELSALVRAGREIEAVRRYRALTRASLLTAVRQVRRLTASA
jgi:hypothetical protein